MVITRGVLGPPSRQTYIIDRAGARSCDTTAPFEEFLKDSSPPEKTRTRVRVCFCPVLRNSRACVWVGPRSGMNVDIYTLIAITFSSRAWI